MIIGLGIGIPFIHNYAYSTFQPFDPFTLFANGEQGAWYDPSDLTTLFQDAAGTTPVTAVEQPVGLMLDKSRGLVASTKGGQMVGVSGSGFDTPSATANQITGDIDIRVQASLVSWTPAAIAVLCSRVLTGNTSADSYEFWIDTRGVLQFYTMNGTTLTPVASSAAVGFAAGTTNWVRVTWQQSTGYVNFYTSSDGVTWTQNGTANRAGQTAAANAGSRILRLGARTEGSFPLNGTVYRAQIYNGINGTLAVDFNPTLYTSGATYTAATGEVWTITGANARIVPNGNHAYQTTSTSRPILSSRVNLLTKTEQFDDAVWVTAGRLTLSANTTETTDPLGGNTAEKAIETIDNGSHRVFQKISFTPNTRQTASVYWKKGTRRWVWIVIQTDSIPTTQLQQWFDLDTATVGVFSNGVGGTDGSKISASIVSDGNGWCKCSLTFSFGAVVSNEITTGVYTGIGSADGVLSYAGNASEYNYIWGASLVPADQADLPYQRVNTATDYDSDPTKFPRFLRCDGIDDGMVTGTIAPGTDKAQVITGVRKLSDSAGGLIAELSTESNANNGTFSLNAPAQPAADYFWRSKGTISASSVTAAAYPAPLTSVMTGIGDIAGDISRLRYNGAQILNITADQGTGNYLAYPLYLFRRGGTTLPFNGHFYGGIIRFGDNLPIETIEQTEAWMNSKTQAIDWRDITDSSSFRWNSATASPDAE